MKSRLFCFISFLFSLFSFSDSHAQNESWVKTFVGTIDKYPFTLIIHQNEKTLSGYYYYDSRQEPMDVSGTIKNNSEISLSDSPRGSDKEEKFLLTYTAGQVVGTWTNTTKTLKVQAKELVNSSLTFDYIYTKGEKTMFPTKKESPTADFSAASVWAKGNSNQAKAINTLISKAFDEKNTEEIGKYFLKEKASFMKDFMGQKAAVVEMTPSFSRSLDESMQLMFQSNSMLMLAHFTYTFEGGAHGNHGVSFLPISLKNNKILHLKDILDDSGIKQLPSLLEKSFRKTYQVKPTDKLSENGLFEDKIKPNENFYITEKGICFVFNPYEIGPYVMGEISLSIPFSDFKGGVKKF